MDMQFWLEQVDAEVSAGGIPSSRFPYILNRVRVGHAKSEGEAASVFGDPEALDGPDVGHSEQESRHLRLGRAATGRLLMVTYTRRRRGDVETIRIISARRASRKERAAYGRTFEQD
jgi:uncharacterized DUF497 family protein